MDIPIHNTIDPTQCLESPLWQAVEHGYGLCPKDAGKKGVRTATCNACPLWSLEDSGIHFLGACRHRDMVKSYIARHNETGRLILEAITKGTSGNRVSIADLGTNGKHASNGSP